MGLHCLIWDVLYKLKIKIHRPYSSIIRPLRLNTIPLRRASSSYNLGTVYQKLKDYDKAIEAYKNALRDNPKHDNARYNLSFCMKQKHKQQQNQDKNQNQNKDKNKKRQKKSPPKDDKKKQQNNDEKLSKDNAEQLLNAAMQEEKATQKRLKKAMRQPTRRNIENNW